MYYTAHAEPMIHRTLFPDKRVANFLGDAVGLGLDVYWNSLGLNFVADTFRFRMHVIELCVFQAHPSSDHYRGVSLSFHLQSSLHLDVFTFVLSPNPHFSSSYPSCPVVPFLSPGFSYS